MLYLHFRYMKEIKNKTVQNAKQKEEMDAMFKGE
nr:MAG TPA: hypothetical protein [Caudoviricetes sp.]